MAIQFDNAVSYLGSWIESEVQERTIEGKRKAKDVLSELLDHDFNTVDAQIDRLGMLTGGTIQW